MLDVSGIRLAVPDDAPAIAQLSRDCVEQGLGWRWTPLRVLRAIRDRSTNVAVSGHAGALAGFAIMRYDDERAHLLLLAVRPAQRRRGLATALLAWLEKCAQVAGIQGIQVEARADNPKAIAFYAARRYRPRAIVRGYYHGVIDAVRLEKRLWERDT